jgi:hypothetical protein
MTSADAEALKRALMNDDETLYDAVLAVLQERCPHLSFAIAQFSAGPMCSNCGAIL